MIGRETMSMSLRGMSRLPWVIWAMTVLLVASGFVLFALTGDTTVGERWGTRWIVAPLAVTFSLVGTLIAFKQVHNRIGWILLVVGVGSSIQFFSDQYAVFGLLAYPGSLPGAIFIAWVFNWIWAFFITFGLVFVPLLFPNGKLVSPRWKIVIWSGSAGIFLMTTSYAFAPGALQNFQRQPNPFGLEAMRERWILLFVCGSVILLASAALAVLSLLIRWRNASGNERQQLKWIAYAATVMVLGASAGFIPSLQIGSLLFAASIMGLPIAIGVAILKYHLFDIDLIIRRTVTYALVTTALVAVFFGSIVTLQQVFAAVTGTRRNELVTVLSTLAIAALFVPLRNTIQNAVNRRFNRRKYDAQRVLTKFAETVRDETDLETLSQELIHVVNETLQPRSATLWLKKPDDSRQVGTKQR